MNKFKQPGLSELGLALNSNTTLKGIDISYSKVGLIGLKSIIYSLKSNKALEFMDLSIVKK